MVTPALAEKPFLTQYGDPVANRENPAFGCAIAYGDSLDGDVPVLVVGAYLADPDNVGILGNDGNAFVVRSPFVDGAPSSVTALSTAPMDDYRFLGKSVEYLPTFSWSNGVPVPSFAVGAPGYDDPGLSGSGRVYLYHNGAQGIVESILTPGSYTAAMGTGHSLSSCDFNGDGSSDLIVGCNLSTSGSGQVTVYLGGPDSDYLPDITIAPVDTTARGFGKYVAGVGKIDDDDYDDITICDGLSGKAYVVFGRQAQQAGTPLDLTVSDDGNTYDGVTLNANGCLSAAGGHDLTGDGIADLVIGWRDPYFSFQWVTVYAGPLDTGSELSVASRIRGDSSFADDLAVDGDVNGDGQPDLLIGSPGAFPRGEGTGNKGMISVFMGGTLPDDDLLLNLLALVHTPDQWFVSPIELDNNAEFGSSVGFMDDQDGDGRDDVFVGAPGMENDQGVKAGRIYGFSLAASDTITLTNLTLAIPRYTSETSLTFTARAVHDAGLPVTVTMNAPDFGIHNAVMTAGAGGTYTHTITYPDVLPGTYPVQYFAVSPWDGTGGDGSFVFLEAEVAVMDNNVVYTVPSDPVTKTGLNYDGTPYSSAVWDFDNDRTKDLFISIRDFDSKLYRGDGISFAGIPHFVEWPDPGFEAGTPQPGLHGVAVGDLDRSDGKSDLFAAHQTDSRLYRWDEDTSKVVNLAPDTGADDFNDVIAGSWGDLDGDGHLDLFLCRADGYIEDPPNYMAAKASPASVVLTNADDGVGSRQLITTPSAGLPPDLYSTNATWGDYDLDGDPDLFVGALIPAGAGASKLYRNDGGILSDQTLSLLGSNPLTAVVASSWHDMNNDGRLDLVLARHERSAAVFYGTAEGGFDDGNGGDAPAVFGPDHGFSGMVVYDYNNDGRLDYLGLSNDPTRASELYVNAGSASGPVFTPLGTDAGLTDQGFVHGAVAADFGGVGYALDGQADLFLGRATASQAFYFKSDPYAVGVLPNNWVGIRIAGPTDQFTTPVIGATVQLEGPNHTQIQQIDGGSFRGGQSSSELIFGLGASKLPVTVAVTWPNGETYAGIPVVLNQFNDITYDDLEVIESTVTSRYDVQVGGQVTWVFTWRTLASVLPTVHKVNFDLAGAPYPCTPECAIIYAGSSPYVSVTCTEVATGQYETEVRWSDRACVPKCKIPFQVESGTLGQTVLSEVHQLAVNVCAGF